MPRLLRPVDWIETAEHVKQLIADRKLGIRQINDTEIPGSFCLIATISALPCPVGEIWFRYITDNQLDIVNMHTHDSLRGLGIMTYLLIALKHGTKCRYLSTPSANNTSASLLERYGFKWHEERNCWLADKEADHLAR